MPAMVDVRKQAVTGLVPPGEAEAIIRVAWPSVAAFMPVATLGRLLMRSIIGAPLAWMLLAWFYFKKILPFLATRYTLTNRRLMIQRGLKPKASREIPLADIDEVRIEKDGNSDFYRAATLRIISKGQVRMTMRGVPGPESFRHAILNACMAWVPNRAASWVQFTPAKADGKAE